MQDQLQAEKQRTNDILTIGREYNAAELAARAVQDGTSLADFQLQVLESRKTGTIHFHNRSYGQSARSHDNLSDDPKLGFRNLGHFCDDVIKACRRNGVKSETLTRAASVFVSVLRA
jgi:hypothetical protein